MTPIFKADQHVEYDPIRKMYLWVRQSEQVFIGGGVSNIDRLAISRDLDHWAVYDLISIRILNQAGIIEPVFDYPDTVLTDRYLYLTTSVYSDDNAKYGLIFRLSLDELSNSLDRLADNTTAVNFEAKLDRDVETVAPIDGASDPMYFGNHLRNNNAIMKIYRWFNDSPSLNSTEVAITPWNGIKNKRHAQILKGGGVMQTQLAVSQARGCRIIRSTSYGTPLSHTIADRLGYPISIRRPST